MPVLKVSRDDVASAIHTLNHQGIPDPGVHRLRRFIGRGSVTTIARFKNELRQIELEKLSPKEQKPLPDPVSELAKRLWDELLAAIDGVEAEIHEATEKRIADIRQQLEDIQLGRDQALQSSKQLADQLYAEQETSTQLGQRLHAMEITLGEFNSRTEANEILLNTLRDRERDLKADMADAARQSALRERDLNAQLNQEREQSLTLRQQFEQHREQLEAQNQELRDVMAGQREHTERTIASLQEHNRNLKLRQKEYQDQLNTLCTERDMQTDTLLQQEKLLTHQQTEVNAKSQEKALLLDQIKELSKLHREAKDNFELTLQQLEARLANADKSS